MKRSGLLLLLAICGAAHAADDAGKVIECVRANVPPGMTIGMIELTMYDRGGGSRAVKGHMYTARDASPKGLMSASLRVDAPADLKGAAYLVRETDDYLRDGMFVYLPTVKRVRRVTGTFADGALFGTNFSYFDFKQMENAFGDLSAKLEGDDTINGRPAHVLSFAPLEGMETRYTGVKAWIDAQACVAVKAEFRQGSRTVKTLSSPAGALRQAGKFWYLAEIEMRDPGNDTRTVLRMDKLETGKAPPPRYFDATAFYLGN